MLCGLVSTQGLGRIWLCPGPQLQGEGFPLIPLMWTCFRS